MQIFLDSNIYCADYPMRGPAFRALFHYLRITKSTLVLSDLVVEEVLATYGREVKKCLRETREPLEKLRRLLLDEAAVKKIELDTELEVAKLSGRLISPSEGIKPLLHSDLSNLSIKDVFMRGVLRRAPAREDGEELRDVIIWFSALACAKKSGNLAFISNDSGFWQQDKPKADIIADISTTGTNVVLYRNIDDFIKAHAPKPEPISDEWFAQHATDIHANKLLLQIAMERACATVESGLKGYEVQSPIIRSTQFHSGELYDTGGNTQFAELALRIELRAEIVRKQFWDNLLSSSGQIDPATSGLNRLATLGTLMRPSQRSTVAQVDIAAIVRVSAYVESSKITDTAIQAVGIERLTLVGEQPTQDTLSSEP
jgi:hypothetical protein